MKKIIISLTLLFFLGTVLKGQDATFTKGGNIELGGSISFLNEKVSGSSSSTNLFSFNPYIGCMIISGFELGVIPGVTVTNETGSSSTTGLNLFLAPAYNINAGKVYPFLEFLIGYNSINVGSNNSGGLGVGGTGGVKFQVGSNGNLIFSFQYLHKSYKSSGSSESTGINNLAMEIGFRIFILKK